MIFPIKCFGICLIRNYENALIVRGERRCFYAVHKWIFLIIIGEEPLSYANRLSWKVYGICPSKTTFQQPACSTQEAQRSN